ncbi:MAG TPA: hypothetical protein PLP19_14830 [bacterium]|nr:hypothetical protein [bacterium]HPN44764.1 hypothetical protein [bacterium]
MNSMMDVIISFVIAGMIILIVIQVDSNVKSSSIFIEQDLHAQEYMKLTADVMNWELRKIGHCLAKPERAIRVADTSRIVFDYNKNPRAVLGFNNGDSTRIEYLFNVLDETTPNPRDKKFIRKIDGASHNGYSLGLTRVFMQYYNKQGTLLATPVCADSLRKIKTIRVNLEIESKEPFKEEYSRFIYSMRITPKNLLGV